ncbi:Hypothetical predicted protein [Paramuricea clavata]|uniref:Uncharacterized protein n=1 Tax=Paramuricea clavata TaxID=317549 RepID=A0A7D9EEM2_PARCT|nr:Hypothetical predicted protein [Paramuricea clavata]
MRTAIANTHVVLNFAIMPGLILIPSDLRILMKPIPGFSNVLTVAKNGMMFRKNEKVNYTNDDSIPTPTHTSNTGESRTIRPIPTVEDFKSPELRQKSDTQNIALGTAAVASLLAAVASLLAACITGISALNKNEHLIRVRLLRHSNRGPKHPETEVNDNRKCTTREHSGNSYTY